MPKLPAAGTGRGLKCLYDCLAMEVQLCNQIGHARPEEGSEHYFAYCAEAVHRPGLAARRPGRSRHPAHGPAAGTGHPCRLKLPSSASAISRSTASRLMPSVNDRATPGILPETCPPVRDRACSKSRLRTDYFGGP